MTHLMRSLTNFLADTEHVARLIRCVLLPTFLQFTASEIETQIVGLVLGSTARDGCLHCLELIFLEAQALLFSLFGADSCGSN